MASLAAAHATELERVAQTAEDALHAAVAEAANAAREAAEAEITWAKAEAKEERDTALAELEAGEAAYLNLAKKLLP